VHLQRTIAHKNIGQHFASDGIVGGIQSKDIALAGWTCKSPASKQGVCGF